MKIKAFYAAAFAALLCLAACGGSNSNQGDTQAPAPINEDTTEIIISEEMTEGEVATNPEAATCASKDCKPATCASKDCKPETCDENCAECDKPECVKKTAQSAVEKGKEKGKEIIAEGKEKGKNLIEKGKEKVAEGKEKGKEALDKGKEKGQNLINKTKDGVNKLKEKI